MRIPDHHESSADGHGSARAQLGKKEDKQTVRHSNGMMLELSRKISFTGICGKGLERPKRPSPLSDASRIAPERALSRKAKSVVTQI